MIAIAAVAVAAAGCSNESWAPPPPGKEQIAVIGKSGDVPARYFLMEQEKLPNGRLNAVVLQQFKRGKPGFPLGFQIDCANGPRWNNNSGETLAAMRAARVPDERMQMGDPSDESSQIARWLCDK
jgi:hypothetical protein